MIRFERQGGVAVVRFDNGRLNIMSRAFHEALFRATMRFLRDDELKVALLTSSPGQSFSAGDDVREFDLSLGDDPDWSQMLLLTPRDKPVVAAVRGHCLGQAFVHLLRLSDVRYAAPDARFGFPEIKAGMGGAGVASGLDGVVPPVVARYYALTGETMSAEVALRHGLVNGVVDDADLEGVALDVARSIARHPLPGLVAETTPLAPFVRSDPYAQAALLEIQWAAMERSLRPVVGRPSDA